MHDRGMTREISPASTYGRRTDEVRRQGKAWVEGSHNKEGRENLLISVDGEGEPGTQDTM